MKELKGLVFAVAVALSVAAAILAAAVYRTWTPHNMEILTWSVSVACVVVPVITASVLTWRWFDHWLDSREQTQRARDEDHARHDAARMLRDLQVLKSQAAASYAEQQSQNALLRGARIAGQLPQPTAIPPAPHPWFDNLEEDSDVIEQ